MKASTLVILAALLGFVGGCKSLHPEPPEFGYSLLYRLAPRYPSLRTGNQPDGSLGFSEQMDGANKAVKDILAIKPAVTFSKKKPVTLAIAEVGESGIETIRQEEKEAWRNALEATGTVRVVFISSVILSADPQFEEIRVAAARLHADTVLLYASASSRESSVNIWGFLYLTVAGLFLSPGNQSAVLTFAKGVCFDVENEYLEFAVEGEDERDAVRPWYFMETDELEIDSRKTAIDILRRETVRALEAKVESVK